MHRKRTSWYQPKSHGIGRTKGKPQTRIAPPANHLSRNAAPGQVPPPNGRTPCQFSASEAPPTLYAEFFNQA